MKLKASLESVRTKKNVTDDIIQTASFNIYGRPDEIAELLKMYQKPIEITIEEVKS